MNLEEYRKRIAEMLDAAFTELTDDASLAAQSATVAGQAYIHLLVGKILLQLTTEVPHKRLVMVSSERDAKAVYEGFLAGAEKLLDEAGR